MSKTRVNRKLPSVEQLIRKHSTARVIAADNRIRILGYDFESKPIFSRALSDYDAVNQMLRKYAR